MGKCETLPQKTTKKGIPAVFTAVTCCKAIEINKQAVSTHSSMDESQKQGVKPDTESAVCGVGTYTQF